MTVVITENSKMYVQLAPDSSGIGMLKDLQHALPNNNRIVDESELHLSILHIGKVSRTIASLQGFTNADAEKIIQESDKLATQLQSLMDAHSGVNFELTPTGMELLGRAQNTLVVSYEETSDLKELHAKSLRMLQSFFKDCGVNDVAAFLKQDENFKYAMSLKPHITIVKSYKGAVPQLSLEPIILRVMDVLQ